MSRTKLKSEYVGNITNLLLAKLIVYLAGRTPRKRARGDEKKDMRVAVFGVPCMAVQSRSK